MRIWKAYAEGRIRLKEDGAVEFTHKPAGVIKHQMEGVWDPRTRSFLKPIEPKPTALKHEPTPAPPKVSSAPDALQTSAQKIFKVRVPKAEANPIRDTLLTLHETFSKVIPSELPLPPPALPISPKKAVQELFYVRIPCPSCGENLYVKPSEWAGVKRSILCGKCGALIHVEFTN
jgi:predicted RNA-binding Zn-ribbon protein involved in translation (DUF1610 family)